MVALEYPLVTIIVLTWNGKNDTLECLRSLQKISYPHWKAVVVDNASADGTVEAVRAEFADVTIIENTTNLRYAGGNNKGIHYALNQNADAILLLNNDTIVDPGFLTFLIETLMADPTNGIVGPMIYYHDDPRRIWYAGGRIEWWKGWISHIGIREIDNGQHDEGEETDYISGCCILVKREIVEKIGMLDTAYYIYGEDVDWCIRASRAGYRLMYEPKAKILHKLSVSTGGHFSWFKNWNKLKSQLRIMARYARLYNWITIPIGFIFEIIKNYFKARGAKYGNYNRI